MTKIDIISGFLGAGKTTLIKRLLADALKGEQVVLIENEFGEIGIDGGFLKDAGISCQRDERRLHLLLARRRLRQGAARRRRPVPPRPHPHRAVRRRQALRRYRSGSERAPRRSAQHALSPSLTRSRPRCTSRTSASSSRIRSRMQALSCSRAPLSARKSVSTRPSPCCAA